MLRAATATGTISVSKVAALKKHPEAHKVGLTETIGDWLWREIDSKLII